MRRWLLLYFVCSSLFWGYDQAFVVTTAWKFPFRRRRRPSKHPSADPPPPPVVETAPASTQQPTTTPSTLASFASGTHEILKDVEDALDEAARQSKQWYHKIRIPPGVQHLYDKLVALILYKPPVGIVTLWTVTRLVTSGRLFRLYSAPKDPKATVEEALSKQKGEQRRALLLDSDDVAYQMYGGVDRVRQQVCTAALHGVLQQQRSSSSSPRTSGANANRDADSLTNVLLKATELQSRSSRMDFLQHAAPLLARMEADLLSSPFSSKSASVSLHAAYATQVRATDALLRVTRDRLLHTTHRLGRTVSYWQKRVASRPFYWFVVKRPPASLAQDRLRLAYATAAYQTETKQLGRVVQLLLERPSDLPAEQLLEAYKESKVRFQQEERDARAPDEGDDDTEEEMLPAPPLKQPSTGKSWFGARRGGALNLTSPVFLRSLSKYYIRWRPEGGGLLSVRRAESAEQIHPDVASRMLLLPEDEPFTTRAVGWTSRARKTICSIVQQSLQGSPSKPKYDLSAEDFEQTSSSWCQNEPTSEEDWKRLLLYVDNLSKWRRVGEGDTVRLKDAALIGWTKRLDIMGIPSTLLTIQVAFWIHEAVLPHWPQFRAAATKAFWKVLEIAQQRVWVPFKGIYDEIMNKSKGMMSGFGLKLEEESLDHLLRDMGFGDGTESTRESALQKAAEQYEHDLNNGLFVNFARGRLVRLLLIQIQQLKVGLLSALDTIDVLMKGNQIHFQFLAAIPAFLIATFGTRFFLRFLYSVRARDLRPVAAAHANMGSYLTKMESLILLDTRSDDHKSLSAATLGELSLCMYRYLMLLDYSAPLFPSAATEQIHASLQGLVGTTLSKDGSSDLALRWLDRIRGQHRDLLKHT